MSVKHQFKPETRRRVFILIYVLSLALCSSYVFAGEQNPRANINGVPTRYKFFMLKHITADNAKQYLEQLGIGTVSKHPKPKTILVTARPDEMLKAGAILKLVDTNKPFVIKVISPADGQLPDIDAISAQIGSEMDGVISTFVGSLKAQDTVKAIIDVHNDSVIVIAPAEEIEKITAAIEQPQAAKPAEQLDDKTAEELKNAIRSQVDPNDIESDVIFEKLLNSLASAKEMAEIHAQQLNPPAETNAVAAELPDEIVIVPQRSTDSIDELAKLLAGLDKETIAGILAAARAEPQPVPQPKEAAPKIEKPAEAVEPSPKIQTYEAHVATGAEGELDLDLPPKLPIADLLRLVGEYLQLDYMYDPAEVSGEVTLNLRGPIKIKELYPLLEQVLKFKDLVMTRKGNLVIIVPKAKAQDIDPDLYRATGRADVGDVIITRIFELEHIDTANAQNFLAGMKLGVNISAIQEAGTLIVTGYAYRMARVEELLEMIDKPGEPKKFRFRQLEYTMAEMLAPKIKTLADQLGTISITISAPKAAAAAKGAARPAARTAAERARRAREAKAKAAAAKQTSAAPPPLEKEAVYLDFDERTNRILMIGLDEQLDEVEKLIDTLDIEQQDLRTLRLYEIQYVGAEEVRDKLIELEIISDTGTGTTSRIRPTATRATGAKTSVRPTTAAAAKESPKDEPQVVIIESTNSLLARATAAQHDQIAMIIGYVDSELEEVGNNYRIYPLENQAPGDLAGVLNQLILDTTSQQGKDAKITTTTTKKIEDDIFIIPDEKTYSLIVYASKKNQQWVSSLIEQLDEYRPQVLIDATLVEISKNEQFDFDIDINVLTHLPHLGLTSSTGAIGESISPSGTAFYKDRDVDIMLEMLQKKGYGRILAKPKLLVNDNEEGTIKSEKETSIAQVKTTVIPAPAGGVPTASQDVSFQSYFAGVTLTITPHISKGDQLQLTIALKRSDFVLRDPTKIGQEGEEEIFPTPPDILTSDVTTVITVPDNHTIILGGLERISQSKSGTKVPILGDIPLIGGIFRTTSNKDDQSRLYVFVKAHILRPGEELTGESDVERVSGRNRAIFEKYEEEMQAYQDWPGIEPEPMDPLKILEKD